MYESFFGLTGLPFQLNPNPSFLFLGTGHRDAFTALQKGLAAGARVMVLTGEVGAGKTTLLQALLANVDPTSYATVQISASGLDAEMLSDRLAEALGQTRLADPLARRDALLETIRSRPLSTLLVIDEGQHLAPSAFDLLETMAKLTESAPVRLQICLVGQPELRILLNAAERSGFRELIGVDCHLRPLEESEIRLYIEHRLHRAGWTGRPEFEDAAFTEIFIFTNGIPRRVNLLCNSLMLSAWLKRQQRIDAPAVTRAAAAIRGDSSQGAPDLLEAGSHFEHAPTLTDEFESDAPGSDAGRVQSDDTHPWTCPTCSSVNAASAHECWSCEAARPRLDGPEQSPGDAAHGTHAGLIPATMSPRPDAVPAESATSTQHADDAPTMSDGTPHPDDAAASQPVDYSSATLVHDQARAARRRRQAILASAVSLAVLALVAYVVNQQTSTAGRSQRELPNVVAKQATVPAPPAPAVESPPPRAATLPGPGSSDVPSAQPPSPELASSAVFPDAAPDHGAPPAASPVQSSPAGSCSAAAVALGLCDADQSPTTRR